MAQSLDLTVYDDGPGVLDGSDPFGKGVGLSALRERLRLLYGEQQHLTLENIAEGGFRVQITIPLRTLSMDRASVGEDAA